MLSRLLKASGDPNYGKKPHWIARTSDQYGIGQCVAGDSFGNVICGVENSAFGGPACGITKLDEDGNLLFSKAYSTTARQTKIDNANRLAIDSSSNIYLAAKDQTYDNTALLIKTDADGVFQWARELTDSEPVNATSVAVDSNDNVVIVGYRENYVFGGVSLYYPAGFIAKYNSSGTLQWQRLLYRSASAVTPTTINDVAIDSSDNIIVCGSHSIGDQGDTGEALIVKYDSSGNVVWQKILGDYQSDDKQQGFNAVSVDSNDNILATGYRNDTNNDTFTLAAKFNSGGTLQWQKKLSASADDTAAHRSVVDSNDDLIVSYYYSSDIGSSSANVMVLKMSGADGSVEWGREMLKFDNDYVHGIGLDNTQNILLVGTMGTPTQGSFYKLQPDGDGIEENIGDGSWDYREYTETIATETLTDVGVFLTSATGTLTNTAVTLDEYTDSPTITTYFMTT